MQRLRLSGGFQRGPQPSFGTRPCLQGIVCYTSAEGIGDGRQPDALLMLSAAWMQIVFSSKGHMPGQSPPQGYTVPHLAVCVPSASHHAKICAIMVITTLESR